MVILEECYSYNEGVAGGQVLVVTWMATANPAATGESATHGEVTMLHTSKNNHRSTGHVLLNVPGVIIAGRLRLHPPPSPAENME